MPGIDQKNILLVEDDPIVATYSKSSLEKYKYNVVHVSTGEKAIETIQNTNEFDLIVMDIDLGDGFDGIETAEHILKNHDIPILFLSSHTEPEIVERTERITSYGYVVKNSSITVLDASIKMAFKLFEANHKLKIELSEHIKTEKELITSKENLAVTLNCIGDGVIATDYSGIVTRMNPTAEYLTGWTFDEAKGKHLSEIFKIVNSQTRIPSVNPVNLVVETGKTIKLSNHTALISRNGQEYHIADSAAPIRDLSKNIIGVVLVFSNVTEKYKAQESLARTMELLERTGELGKIGGWQVDLSTMKQSWTLETFRITGLEPPIAPPLEDGINLFPPNAKPIISAAVQAAIEEGKPYDLELPIITAQGKNRWVQTQGFAEVKDGKTVRLFGTFQDITERKKAEEQKMLDARILEVLAKGGKLEDLLNSLLIAFEGLLPNTQGSILLLDKEGKHLKHGAAQSLPEEYRKAVDGLEIGPSVGSCGTAAYTGEITMVADIENNPLWENFKDLALSHNLRACWAVPIKGVANNVLGVFAFYHHTVCDATKDEIEVINRASQLASIIIERDYSMKALNESEEKYRNLIESSMEGTVVNLNGSLVFANRAALNVLGAKSIEDIRGKSAIELIHPDYHEIAIKRIRNIIENKNSEELIEMKFIRVDGSNIDVEVQSTAIEYEGKPATLTVFHDITERKKADEKIKSLLVEKEIILKEVHHRIKNNMSMINGLLSIQSYSLEEPVAKAALEDAIRRIRSMTILYDKLYQTNKLFEVSVSNYLPDLIDEIITNFPSKKPISVTKEIEDFKMDSKKMQNLSIIINEILTNACKHAFKEKENGSIFISLRLIDTTITLSYKDNGKGIPSSILSSNETGFGLTLIRDLTKQIKGSLKIEAESGTVIRLEFKI